MKLSVIVLNHNTKVILKKCLQKCQQALVNIQAEIIVVDSASTDKSPEMVEEFFPKIKLIRLKENLGFSIGNNIGVKKSCGDYVVFLNSDVLVKKDAFEMLLKYMDDNKEVGAITPKLVLRNNKIDPDCHRGFPTPWAALSYFLGLEKLFPKSKIFGQYHQMYKNMQETHYIDSCCGAFMLVRKEAGDQVGWWSEEYFFYGEDLDFCYSLKQKDWEIAYFPHVESLHYKGASSGIRKETKDLQVLKETRVKAAQESIKAMEIFYNKFYKDKYPQWLTNIVLLGIKLKGKTRLFINKVK